MYSIYVDQYHFNTEQRGPQRKQHFEGGHIKKLFRFKDTLYFCHSLSLFGILDNVFLGSELRKTKSVLPHPLSATFFGHRAPRVLIRALPVSIKNK